MIEVKCDHCGATFKTYKSSSAKWRFCNKECLRLARMKGGVIAKSRQREFKRVCPTCKNEFTYTLHNKKQRYCNRECAGVERRAGGEIARKVDETTLKNHGVRRVFQDTKRLQDVLEAKYGVRYISQLPGLAKENWKKSHATKKRNGTYKSSKIERDFADKLCEQDAAFETQVVMFGRPIDFKVDDIYVQIDGRYWHGLDRPIEEIRASSYPRDQSIYQRWCADREQDEQFATHALKLVRVTDQEAKEWLRERRVLKEQLLQKSMKLPTSPRN